MGAATAGAAGNGAKAGAAQTAQPAGTSGKKPPQKKKARR
jgi:hypothetical protein